MRIRLTLKYYIVIYSVRVRVCGCECAGLTFVALAGVHCCFALFSESLRDTLAWLVILVSAVRHYSRALLCYFFCHCCRALGCSITCSYDLLLCFVGLFHLSLVISYSCCLFLVLYLFLILGLFLMPGWSSTYRCWIVAACFVCRCFVVRKFWLLELVPVAACFV